MPCACSTGAGPGTEGDEPGECSDRADNDRDGLIDCDDEGCAGSPSCDCADDAECDDGLFCTGNETCSPGAEGADERGCLPGGGDPCLDGQECSETEDRCVSPCATTPDADGDGADAIECGGQDCDDSDPSRYPGAGEVCDGDDEDCDPTTRGEDSDQDGDGFVSVACCNEQPDGSDPCGDDCDDTMSGVNPGTPESCNGVDDDCDGWIDEDVLETVWLDADGDGFGDPEVSLDTGCVAPEDYVRNDTDCDDDEPRRNPGAPEVCDDVPDNDCNGADGGGTWVGSYTIDELSDLMELSGYESVTGWLDILDPSEVLVDLTGLECLMSVGGNLSIEYMVDLTNIDGLSGLTSVGGNVSIEHNCRLPTSAAEALVARLRALGWDGTADISDNGTGTCP
jgi:hypothetical protein